MRGFARGDVMMDSDVLFVLQFSIGVGLLLSAAHAYRVYIAPFDSLRRSVEFWRLRRCFKKFYNIAELCQLSLTYREQQSLDNVEFTYGEILLHSFYQAMKAARPMPHEIFYDLGSGAGKLIHSAAILFDLRKVCGVEIQQPLFDFSAELHQKLQTLSKHDARWQQQLDKVEQHLANILEFDFSDADIVFINATCFQLEHWRALEVKFKQLKQGARVIITTKYLKEPEFVTLHTQCYDMSWGYARVSVFRRTKHR